MTSASSTSSFPSFSSTLLTARQEQPSPYTSSSSLSLSMPPSLPLAVVAAPDPGIGIPKPRLTTIDDRHVRRHLQICRQFGMTTIPNNGIPAPTSTTIPTTPSSWSTPLPPLPHPSSSLSTISHLPMSQPLTTSALSTTWPPTVLSTPPPPILHCSSRSFPTSTSPIHALSSASSSSMLTNEFHLVTALKDADYICSQPAWQRVSREIVQLLTPPIINRLVSDYSSLYHVSCRRPWHSQIILIEFASAQGLLWLIRHYSGSGGAAMSIGEDIDDAVRLKLVRRVEKIDETFILSNPILKLRCCSLPQWRIWKNTSGSILIILAQPIPMTMSPWYIHSLSVWTPS